MFIVELHSPSICVAAFFLRIWKRLHDERPDGLKIEPPQKKAKKTNSNSKKSASKNENSATDGGSNSDELKRFRENITRITGNMSGDNIMNSMMVGGFMNPTILNAMSGGTGVGGGNQSMMTMPRFAEGNDGRKSGEGDQQKHAQV